MLIDELMRIMSELESGAEPDDPYSDRSSDDDSDFWSDGDTDGEWNRLCFNVRYFRTKIITAH